jgi:hypothetical protein
MNTLEAIAQAEFVATDEQVTQLARIAAEGRQAGGTFLKVLFAHVKSVLVKKRKPSRKTQVEAVDEINARLYEHVLKGVGPDELEVNERNRRATFARTAASTLRHFAKRGRKPVTALSVEEVTKTKLRALSGAVPAGTRTERVLNRSADSFMRMAQRMAKADPASARKRIAALQAQLAKVLAQLADEKKAPAKVAVKAKSVTKRKAIPARIMRAPPGRMKPELRAH